jgi:hypothetical protein
MRDVLAMLDGYTPALKARAMARLCKIGCCPGLLLQDKDPEPLLPMMATEFVNTLLNRTGGTESDSDLLHVDWRLPEAIIQLGVKDVPGYTESTFCMTKIKPVLELVLAAVQKLGQRQVDLILSWEGYHIFDVLIGHLFEKDAMRHAWRGEKFKVKQAFPAHQRRVAGVADAGSSSEEIKIITLADSAAPVGINKLADITSTQGRLAVPMAHNFPVIARARAQQQAVHPSRG